MIKTIFLPALVSFCLLPCQAPQTQKETEAVLSDMAHNSRNSLSWSGTYFGVLPCADCEGIETLLTVEEDLTYRLSSKYLGKSAEPLVVNGNFSWNDAGSEITLTDTAVKFKVQENSLLQLDQEGAVIKGDLADKYILSKMQDGLCGPTWNLLSLKGKSIGPMEGSGKIIHIIFTESGSKVTGNAGCNTYNGGFERTAQNGIRFSKFMTTRMACPDNVPEYEYLSFLSSVSSFSISGDTLRLFSPVASAKETDSAVFIISASE